MDEPTPGWPPPPPPPPPPSVEPASPPSWYAPPADLSGLPVWARPGGDPHNRASTNWFAVASLVFGILGGIPLAVTFGIIALRQIRRRGQQGRGVAIGGLVAAGGWLALMLVGVVLHLTDDADPRSRTVPLDDLEIRDCLEEVSPGAVLWVDVVPCDAPHWGQIYAGFELPDEDWPGDDAVIGAAETGCLEALEARFPAVYDDPGVGVIYFHPRASGWRRGDREVLCVADYGTDRRTGDLLASSG